MDRVEFMRQLEALLWDISPAEREEALRFYNNYFDDAGIENEQSVIKELYSPARVAENIKSGLAESGIVEPKRQNDAGQQAGNGQTWQQAGSNAQSAGNWQNNDGWQNNSNGQNSGGQTGSNVQNSGKLPSWAIVLIVIAIIFTAPVWMSVVGTLFGALVAWFAMIFAFGVIALVFLAMLVVFIVLAVTCFVVHPMVSVALIGGGLLFGGFGTLMLMLTVAMAGIATPAIFRGIAGLFKYCKRAIA